jgi:superfamily II DNA or RNA helicase
MSIINVEKRDEVNLFVWSDLDIEFTLEEFFSFYADGYKFMPRFRAKLWDGKVRMYSAAKKTLPVGLFGYLEQFAAQNDCEIRITEKSRPIKYDEVATMDELKEFCKSLSVQRNGQPIEHYDYQLEAIHKAINERRTLLLSATGSGKSLIIYSILRWYQTKGLTALVLVPTTGLVEQMLGDFKDYSTENGWDAETFCQQIYSGFTKEVTKDITISTWQSVYKLDRKWFSNFDVVVGDEAHLFAAASLSTCMNKLQDVSVRIGTTGTIKEAKSNKLTLEGHFGPVHKVSSTRELMDKGVLTDLKIKCLVLKHDEMFRREVKDYDYQGELDWIVRNDKRNKFICKLAGTLSGTTLILFQFVEKHGVVLHDMLKQMYPNRPVYLIHGGVSVEERERIRKALENDEDPILAASAQTFATGVNAPSIENIIFASPTKSRIRNLQSIGRGLRLKKGKDFCNLYDISDDLSWKKKPNATLRHALDRIKIYAEEQFPYKLIEVPF